MIRKKGVLYYTEEDILDLFYKTSGAWKLEEMTREGSFTIEEVRDGLKWVFNTNDYDNLSIIGDFYFVAVPIDVIEAIFIQKNYQNVITNPVITNDGKENANKMIKTQEDFLDSKELNYYKGITNIEDEPCYIWFFKDDRLVGVFNVVPSVLLEGPLNPKMIYICEICKKCITVSNNIPDLYYDADHPDSVYCKTCASKMKNKNILHMGE